MEGMEDTNEHLTSAAAFVEGGIQDACDDACSICLEEFCETDPSAVTSCKHEFHLQCVLEWCQRSPQCPLCWQPISMKDPISQELLEAVEHERSFRSDPSRNATVFHHPTLGDFDLHLPVGANVAELKERIMQQLAAAMGRARHIARSEGPTNRSSAQARPQLVVSAHPNTIATPSSPDRILGEEYSASITPIPSVQADQWSASASGSRGLLINYQGSNNRSPNRSPNSHDRAGPSEFQSFSESLKSKFNAASMRYKESISKSTRGWKERFFSRNTSVSDLGSQVRGDVNAGIATVSHMMERLESRDNTESHSQQISDAGGETPSTETMPLASCATSSASK